MKEPQTVESIKHAKAARERASDASFEDEISSRRMVTISLKEYDELKAEENFIKSKTLIDIIDNIERLVRALRKHIIRK